MTTVEKPLIELIATLPPHLQDQVRSYVNTLLEENPSPSASPLKQTWAGALRDFRGQMTSVELQHRALDWMTGSTRDYGKINVPR